MKLFVVGATGRTGTALVEQALARGHDVTAFSRSRYGSPAHEHLRVIAGSPLNADELAAVLPDHDAVLSALGTRHLGATSLLADGAHALIEAMTRVGVRRLVVMSSSLLDENAHFGARFAARTILRHHTRDQRAMEQLVARSDLEWTIVRPARLTMGPLTRRYFIATDAAPGKANTSAMSRNDAAHVMLDAAESHLCVRQIVWLRGVR